jgi:stage III sporulation protein SpoIIIAA
MGPAIIAVDEITAERDSDALLRAGRCGVDLLATAHASERDDLRFRPIYEKLLKAQLFQWIVILQRDKSWTVERMVK